MVRRPRPAAAASGARVVPSKAVAGLKLPERVSCGGWYVTPIRRQYLKVKHSYPDAIVLFRLGDFYETFDDDARLASQELEITLTSRSMGKNLKVPMAGVPAHAMEGYLARLIKRGHKVAICEQLSDPSSAKGLVDRDVVRVVTPGTVFEAGLLDQKSNNYLAALIETDTMAGLAHVDISTGEFRATQLDLEAVIPELERIGPAEVLTPGPDRQFEQSGDSDGAHLRTASPQAGRSYVHTPIEPSSFGLDQGTRSLLDLYGILSLESLGCQDKPLLVQAAGAIISYLAQTQKSGGLALSPLGVYSTENFMALDTQTRTNLELFQAGRFGSGGRSLLSILDQTQTPMGGRLIRSWLGQPLLEVEPLEQRLDAVEFFFQDGVRRAETLAILRRIPDLERILSRVKMGTVMPRELAAMGRGLEGTAELATLLAASVSGTAPVGYHGGYEEAAEPFEEGLLEGSVDSPDEHIDTKPEPDRSQSPGDPVAWLRRTLVPLPDVAALIRQAIADEPSGMPGEGNVIRQGFAPELDELKAAASDARGFIAGLEQQERERTGIRNLKVGYNQVFGYYIEISKANAAQAPEDYIRRQTLANAERYVVPKLKEYESLALSARERIEETERAVFRRVCAQIGESSRGIGVLAQAVSQVDVFAALAQVAADNGYVRPGLETGDVISIDDGRHPVVEQVLDPGAYVSNDVQLDGSECPIVVLTGPNMAGKSTFIRQAAIITLMAQVGSFVPAARASIGLVDRIFTRVGLQDDLGSGQSTFMVEMVETAAILNQATPKSLVILDEMGRGTSTYDGMSIARSVIEHLHNDPRLGCKTLFATHYHELTELANILPGVRNFSVAVAEENGDVVFLHRIVPGGADKSYGVHVARLAGLPKGVINRAWEVLEDLEREGRGSQRSRAGNSRSAKKARSQQISLFQQDESPVVDEVRRLDIANLTPLEAINKLYQLQEQAKADG